jgi:uncharacterized membrane protein
VKRNTSAADAGKTLGRRMRPWFIPGRQAPAANPALEKHARERAQELQNRIADGITSFAGSMPFVYIHVLWFACWIGFGVESYPYGLLTMIVSLEAIFLSTFVMISQNRADARRQVVADQQWEMIQEEEQQNEELIRLNQEILRLAKEARSHALLIQGARDDSRRILELSRQTLATMRDLHADHHAPPRPTPAGSVPSADAHSGQAEAHP